MRLVSYHHHGGPDVLRVEEVPVPVPGPGQLLLRTDAVGVNFIETQLRSDSAPFPSPLPGRPGGDVVGRVEALGPGTEGPAPGTRVAAYGVSGAYADHVLAEAARTLEIPEDIDPATATALASTAQVAWSVLDVARLAPGESVLVHAAAGAIGHLVTQLAKRRGARLVIGTVGSPAKDGFVRAHGADEVVDYSRPDWGDRVRELTGGAGVDVVLDSVEGAVFQEGLRLLKPFGRLVYYGFADAGAKPAQVTMTDLLGLKSVIGTSFDAWTQAAPARAAEARADLVRLVADGDLRVAVHAVLPLAEAAEAHRIIEARTQLGRVVLIP
ncbi:quinone oxidoreductase family protein [Streptomyces xanthophaeus]|uniref:quinone oxidoreductase family protein n=1 Tax=Streptomyces xanthophaeus TaxID=67385 RepID=UPI00264A2288|nr:zinc-binding dehydrogenase [Streptomyces xanthophaeus]WKD32298.1 zinc-binding dehydrogenase [Streptomyces xanthophaeus]